MKLPELLIIDDFYEDPFKIRELAEKVEYFSDHDSGYFHRSKSHLTFEVLAKLEGAIDREIEIDKNWDKDTTYNGSFYVISPNKPLPQHVHHDQHDMVGIVSLSTNFNNDNLGDGTCFWRHKSTGKTKARTVLDVDPLSKDGDHLDRWIMTDFIGHKFNTLILYPGARFHSARIGKLDRLNQLFVFNLHDYEKKN